MFSSYVIETSRSLPTLSTASISRRLDPHQTFRYTTRNVWLVARSITTCTSPSCNVETVTSRYRHSWRHATRLTFTTELENDPSTTMEHPTIKYNYHAPTPHEIACEDPVRDIVVPAFKRDFPLSSTSQRSPEASQPKLRTTRQSGCRSTSLRTRPILSLASIPCGLSCTPLRRHRCRGTSHGPLNTLPYLHSRE